MFQTIAAGSDSKGNILIEAVYASCPADMGLIGDVNCLKEILFTSQDTTIRLTSNEQVFLGDEITNDLPFKNRDVFVKKATSDFFVVRAFGVVLKFSPNKKLYISVYPFYAHEVSCFFVTKLYIIVLLFG